MNSFALVRPETNVQVPRFIAVEGPIGVGKTSLTKRLAETFNYEILLENPEENPFLERFYRNSQKHALATQLFFLFQRSRQIQELRQNDLFSPVRVADFLIDKDHLFAKLNLDTDEYDLYQKVYAHLTIDSPVPDLVIYLQAPTSVLLNRIQKRGIGFEQLIERDYLEQLNSAYTRFFHYFDTSPLLIVNCAEIDLVSNDQDYQQLVDYILTHPRGTQYFNPKPNMAE
jgi:deoxyguanosine kinase